jgi:Ca2+-binding EF-hand superfamily protein
MSPQHTLSVTPALSRGPSLRRSMRFPWISAQGRDDVRSGLVHLAFLATLLFLATPAFAQQTETDAQSAERYFDRLDQKKQGFFTLADMQRVEAKTFIRTDDDKDGSLTLSEFNFGIPDEREDIIDRFTRRFRLADADNNGRITMDEYMEFCERVVAAADANQDGMVTKEEFVAASSGGATE